MSTQTIDGTFPDFSRVIPSRDRHTGYAVISPATMRRVPETGSCVQGVKMDLATQTLTAKDVFLNAEIYLPIEARGDFAVGFNSKYLRAFTAAFGVCRIEMTSAGDAATVLSEDPAWLGVLMPMRV